MQQSIKGKTKDSEWKEALISFPKENSCLIWIGNLVKEGTDAEFCFGIPVCYCHSWKAVISKNLRGISQQSP